jgi:hydroxymethylpyrimidine pyrophosphatase-like HAD family hydrolase
MGNMTTNSRLVVTDLDNTLLHRDKSLSEYTVHIFERLHESGILVALATARHLVMTPDYQARIRPDALALSNGARIMAGGQLAKKFTMPPQIASALLMELAASGKMLKISARGQQAVYSTAPDYTYEWQKIHDFREPIADRISHLSFRCEDEQYARMIIDRYKDLEFWHNSGDILYDVNPFGATKANAASA